MSEKQKTQKEVKKEGFFGFFLYNFGFFLIIFLSNLYLNAAKLYFKYNGNESLIEFCKSMALIVVFAVLTSYVAYLFKKRGGYFMWMIVGINLVFFTFMHFTITHFDVFETGFVYSFSDFVDKFKTAYLLKIFGFIIMSSFLMKIHIKKS